MWRLHLMLSLQVISTMSLPIYLPEMIPQSPLPMLQEELMRLQGMQVQRLTEMQQLQAMQVQASPEMQQLQNMPGMQQDLPGSPYNQHIQDMQQLAYLQNMQHLQEARDMHQLQAIQATPMNQIQPIVVLLPGLNIASDSNSNQEIKRVKDKKEHKETVDEDLESVAIEAEEPIPVIEDQKAIILSPNPRFSLNAIISAIPFLPFEINVPDTIAWMYNGIISIIGQIQGSQSNRLKFKNGGNIGNFKPLRPIIVIPL